MLAAEQTERKPAPGLQTDGHIPALDGIRGAAVLMVMVLHFCLHGGMGAESSVAIDQHFLRFARSGWVGVDLFFVMSGFLITGILWSSREREGYFVSFYARRLLRIFPLYYAYLIVRLLILPQFFPELAIGQRNQSLFWTYTSNAIPVLRHHVDGIGWERFAGLHHFWSLAVEEQFYLLWPFLVWKLDRTKLMRLCALLVVITPFTRILLRTVFEPEAAYVFSAGRLDALAIGAYCALAMRGPEAAQLRRWVRPVLAVTLPVLALIFLMRGRLISSDLLMQTVGYSAVALTAAALLIRALESPGVFGWKWLQWLGGLCYGLYVFNGPLARLMGKFLPVTSLPTVMGSMLPAQLAILTLGLAINVLIAWVVWHGFEKHFNNLKHNFPRPGIRVRTVTPRRSSGLEQPAVT